MPMNQIDPGPKANILLVDDQPANLLALEVVLEELGQNLVKAPSGEQALRLLQEHDFAVVLLDVQMPGLDGFDTAKQIRGQERVRHTPIIFLTAYEDHRFPVDQAYTLGAVDYLTKPVVPVILRAKVAGFVELFHKTEQIKRQAEQLRRLERGELEGKLAEENARLRLSEERLREEGRRKDEFLAMLAHELRNPLAPVRNGLEILKLQSVSMETVAQVRAMMARQVEHLVRIVDDLLDVSRIQRGKATLQAERLDLARLGRTAAEDHRLAVEKAGLHLELESPEVPLWVQGDPTWLTQILGNLLQNAIKFTERGGAIKVRIGADAARQQAVLSVRDTGIGIAPETLPRLFETFAQADRSLDRSKGGLGLGLALVKGLVGLHAGEVSVSSTGLGQGAEFTVKLPMQEEPSALLPTPLAAKPSRKRLRILVVEDNRDAADSLRILLELFGHEVSVAYSGTCGVQTATAWHPDVVLCDIGLPGMNGYEVVSALRSNPLTASSHIIAVTGYGADEDKLRSQKAGFDQHLTKPVDPETLQATFASLS